LRLAQLRVRCGHGALQTWDRQIPGPRWPFTVLLRSRISGAPLRAPTLEGFASAGVCARPAPHPGHI